MTGDLKIINDKLDALLVEVRGLAKMVADGPAVPRPPDPEQWIIRLVESADPDDEDGGDDPDSEDRFFAGVVPATANRPSRALWVIEEWKDAQTFASEEEARTFFAENELIMIAPSTEKGMKWSVYFQPIKIKKTGSVTTAYISHYRNDFVPLHKSYPASKRR